MDEVITIQEIELEDGEKFSLEAEIELSNGYEAPKED